MFTKLFIAVVVVFGCWVTRGFWIMSSPERQRAHGIVVLSDYQDAMALCGEHGPELTINKGHEHDGQVAVLKRMAALQCVDYARAHKGRR